jgi:hypothetical protein
MTPRSSHTGTPLLRFLGRWSVRVHVRECMQGFGCASWFGSGAGRCGPEEEPILELGWEDLENDGRSIVRLGKRESKGD